MMTYPTLVIRDAFVRSEPKAPIWRSAHCCQLPAVLLFAGYAHAAVGVDRGLDFIENRYREIRAENEVASWRVGAQGVASGTACRHDDRGRSHYGRGDPGDRGEHVVDLGAGGGFGLVFLGEARGVDQAHAVDLGRDRKSVV